MSENIIVEPWIHIPITVIVFIEFCLAIQQLLGSPTQGNKKKVFRYRATVTISTFTTLLISIALNLELTQDRIDKQNDKDDIVGQDFAFFIYFLMIAYVAEALILGYWFFNDAVRAAYKATKGINQAAPPKWIRKFWLVVIVIEQSILVLCFIFAFAMENTTFLNIIWITAFFVATSGSGIVLACVISVYKSISSAINNGNDTQIKTLTQARRTLTIIGLMGFVFGSLAMAALIRSLIGVVETPDAFTRKNMRKSTVLDTPLEYLTYILMIISLNFILMLWTYRSSNINYCCFCWTYKKYTTNGDQHREIDDTVVCYRCFPTLIEEAEDRRQRIIEDSLNGTDEHTPKV